MTHRVILITCFSLVGTVACLAGSPFVPKFSSDLKSKGPAMVQAVRADKPPVLDGKLSDLVWAQAQQAKAFYSLGKNEPADEQTIAMFAYDDKNLYVGVVCQDPEMEYLVAAHTKHNSDVNLDDSIELFLGMDQGGAWYQLIVNPAGVTTELKWVGNVRKEWNPRGLQVKTSKSDSSWSLELAIPLDQIPLEHKPGSAWKMNLCRNYYVGEEDYVGINSSWADLGLGSKSYLKPELFGTLILGQKNSPASQPAPPGITGVAKCTKIQTPPKLDGDLNEDVWKKAAKITNFWEVSSLEPAQKQTIASIVCTDTTLYFGIRCEDPDMEYLVGLKEHKNNQWQDDCVEIFLGDPKAKENYVNLMINPLGLYLAQKQDKGAGTWNPKIEVAVKKGTDFWSIEVGIPFSQIPLDRTSNRWALNICRSFYTESDSYVRNKSSWAKLNQVARSIYNNTADNSGFYHQPKKFGTLLLGKE